MKGNNFSVLDYDEGDQRPRDTDGRPELVDLGMPLFTDLPRQGSKPLEDRESS